MASFLLYWNPFFSSYKVDRFMEDFDFSEGKEILTALHDWNRMPGDFNWSIVQHEKAHKGDRFIFIRVGYERPTGLIGVGEFVSEPYEDEDWSGQGRKIYYMDMDWDSVANPTSDKILSTEALAKAIPEVEWTKGKAGVEVAPEIAEKIEALWHEHILNILRLE